MVKKRFCTCFPSLYVRYGNLLIPSLEPSEGRPLNDVIKRQPPPQAPNLLLPDLATGRPLQLDFTTQTYDGEIGHSVFLGNRHRLT